MDLLNGRKTPFEYRGNVNRSDVNIILKTKELRKLYKMYR